MPEGSRDVPTLHLSEFYSRHLHIHKFTPWQKIIFTNAQHFNHSTSAMCFKICHILVAEQQEPQCRCKVGHETLQRIHNSSSLITARLLTSSLWIFAFHIKQPGDKLGLFPTEGAKRRRISNPQGFQTGFSPHKYPQLNGESRERSLFQPREPPS